MPLELPEALDRLAQIQRGVLTSRQVRAGGLTKDVIRHRIRTGRWQQLYHGVYAVFSGSPGIQAALWAAVLRGGQGALLSHHTAAFLHGLTDTARAPVHLTIPDTRRVAPITGLVVHVSSRAQLAGHPTALPPRTTVEETIIDLAHSAVTAENACGWVARGIGRRLTNYDRLGSAISERRRLRFRAELVAMLTPEAAGVHSPLEHRYLRWVEVPHALPTSKRQVRVQAGDSTVYRDVLYEDYGLIVELDGRAAHPGDTRWKDIRRDNAAAASGQITLRYGWDDLRLRPCLVAQQVVAALRRSGPVNARPCSPTCPVRKVTETSRSARSAR